MYSKNTKVDKFDFIIENKFNNFGKFISTFYYDGIDSALQLDYIGFGFRKEIINYSILLTPPKYNRGRLLRFHSELKSSSIKDLSTLEKLIKKYLGSLNQED